MAKAKQGGGGVSLRSADAIQTGLFQGGRCTMNFLFGEFDYGANGRHPALIVTYTTEDGETSEEPYGVGSGWKIAPDGSHLIPRQGQTGIGRNTDSMLYLITPLEEALDAAGIAWPGDGSDITDLDGLVCDVARRPVQARDFGDRKSKGEGERKEPKTKLVVTEVVSAPWAEGGKKKAKAAPAKSKASKPADDDDDDEDDGKEEPAPKAKGGKVSSKAKGKVADDDDEDLDTTAQEAVVEVLEDEGGPVSVEEDLAELLMAALKGNPERKAIVARATDPEFLATGAGWTYNKKKGTVAID